MVINLYPGVPRVLWAQGHCATPFLENYNLFDTNCKMPYSKIIIRMIPISSGLMKCTCGQMIKYETEREEKMKL